MEKHKSGGSSDYDEIMVATEDQCTLACRYDNNCVELSVLQDGEEYRCVLYDISPTVQDYTGSVHYKKNCPGMFNPLAFRTAKTV